MPRALILYYSTYGHIETMARAVAEGCIAGGASADVRRVPETVADEIASAAHFKMNQSAPFASVEELPGYDAILVGAPTRFGRLPGQMAQFWDQTGALWMRGALVGKLGAAFTATATQHGGQETTLLSILTMLLHHGMVVSGLPYAFTGQTGVEEVKGGSPYGASTITAADGSRLPSQIELEGARYLGRHVAALAARRAPLEK